MNKDAKEAAKQFWDNVYCDRDYVFGSAPNAWFESHSSLMHAGQRILMVADGEGRNSVWCARKKMIVDAFDLSEIAIQKAKKLAKENQVTVNFSVNGIDDWPWQENIYDAVAIILCQFATPSMRQIMFNRCIGTLKEQGLLFVLGYSTKQLEYGTGGPPYLDHLYTESMLSQYAKDMEILELKSWDADVKAGRHEGKSALIGMIARKSKKDDVFSI